jgi:RND family efflux transporter MFP subunit
MTSSNQQPTSKTANNRILFGVVAVMAGLFMVGLLPRLQRQTELNTSAQAAKTNILTVNTVTPDRANGKSTFLLPGSVQAIQETTLYARTNGYLKQRLVDIGDRVKAGQLLAEIESPEVDQELAQARANFAQTQSAYLQAQANLQQSRSTYAQVATNSDLAKVSAQRWQELQKQGAVARQDFDEKQAAFKASQANVGTAQSSIQASRSNVEAAMAVIRASAANVRRVEAMQSFKRITAPFSGTITARNVDSGALISAGSGGSNAVWLFKLAQPKTLRIFVDVPQASAASIHPGQAAKLMVRELPNQTFTGTVTRTANALDPASRTLRTEVQVPNPGLKLLPGMYAQVQFTLDHASSGLRIPANALVVRSEGTQVAMVGQGQKVHYQNVTIGRDYGTEIEIASGLVGNEQLIVNPTDDIREGTSVRAVATR